MRRLSLLLLAVVLCGLWMTQAHAQTTSDEIRFQGRIAEVRQDLPRGIQLQTPDPIPLAANAAIVDEQNQPLALSALTDRVYNAQDQVRVRVTLNDQKQIVRLAVMGLSVVAPTDLKPEERSFTVLFVDVNKREVIPTGFSFVEVTVLDTRILAEDGRRISLNDLQAGSLVGIVGRLEGARFVAWEIKVLQRVVYTGVGGTIVKIERDSAMRGTVYLDEGGGDEWVAMQTPVFLNGEQVGTGPGPIRSLLNSTEAPVVATLSNRDLLVQGKWGRVDLEVGKAAFGRQWEEDRVTFQLPADPAQAVRGEYNEGYALFAVPPSIPVDERTTFRDQTRQGVEMTFDELMEFMNVHINLELAGSEVLRADVDINERPQEVRLTLRVSGRDASMNRIWFDTPSIRLAANVRFIDPFGNPTDARQLEEMQGQGPEEYVALVTVTTDPVSGEKVGAEVRLVAFRDGISPGPDQIVIGEFGGMRRGFWVNPTEIGAHGTDGVLLPDAVVRTPDGQAVSPTLIDSGIEAEVVGAAVSGRIYIRELVVLSAFEPFEVVARIRYIDWGGRWMEFEDPPPIYVDQGAEVLDHDGFPASLGFIAELLDQVALQIRLTYGDMPGPDGSPTVVRVEAFRPDAQVEVGVNQQLIVGGRIDPWAFQVFPSSIRNVQFSGDTQVLDASGTLIPIENLEASVRVRVAGHAIERGDGDPHGDRFTCIAERIQVLGGAVTEYRGTVKEVRNGVLYFEPPRPLQVMPQTDLREETGFSIDFFTLAARIRSEGGLRLEIGADFGAPGNPQVWHARIMWPDEPAPQHIQYDQNQIVAVIVEVDEESRTLLRAPLPAVALTEQTVIVGAKGEVLATEALVAGASVVVQAEKRDGDLVAAEIHIKGTPTAFEFIAPLSYVDPVSAQIFFEIPPFVTVAPDAVILDQAGQEVDLSELKQQLLNTPADVWLLRITQTPDSPTDAPIAAKVEVLTPGVALEAGRDEFIVAIDDPGGCIRVYERRIEPAQIPPVYVSLDAEVWDLDGRQITLQELPEGSRVHVKGMAFQDRLSVSEIRVVGGRTFTGEGVLGMVDVENRLIAPAPDPPSKIDVRAFIADQTGRRITLSMLADFLQRNPDLIVAITFDPFGSGVASVQLIDPQFGRQPGPEERFVGGSEIEVDVDGSQILFKAPDPVRVAEDAQILGPNGAPLTLAKSITPLWTLYLGPVGPSGAKAKSEPFFKTAIILRRAEKPPLPVEPRIASYPKSSVDLLTISPSA